MTREQAKTAILANIKIINMVKAARGLPRQVPPRQVEEFELCGKTHRVDGPAITWDNGKKEWWLYGAEHRVDGPAITWPNGTEEWYFRGGRHRDGAPAVSYYSGGKEWWSHDTLHREDGPAKEYKDKCEWYLNGERVRSMDEFQALVGLSDESIAVLILKYGKFNAKN